MFRWPPDRVTIALGVLLLAAGAWALYEYLELEETRRELREATKPQPAPPPPPPIDLRMR